MFGPHSIRHKITFGYYTIVFIIVGLSLFTLMELRFLEKKIVFGDVISEFFDVTLEVRRFEKNYFLYREKDDFQENMKYITRAREILETNLEGFILIAGPEKIGRLRTDLAGYQELVEKYSLSLKENLRKGGMQNAITEAAIRKRGKDIITIAEYISRTERRYLQRTISNSQTILFVSILVLSLLVIVVGQVLSRMVVRPLKLLQKDMESIAEGRFETIRIDSKDREIVSLTNAFSKMLKELELRQRHLIQSGKLASLGTLLSGVAHELNNPLSNISTSCQILTEEIGESDMEYKRELLGQIDEQTDRARNIVRSLLEFSRDREFSKEELQLRRLLEETIAFVKGQIPAGVEMRLNVPDSIYIYADKQRMQQAFLNLIKNAVEATEGDGAVSITAHRITPGERPEEGREIYGYLKYSGKCVMNDLDTVDIEIADTGSGIPPEVLPKVFDPFFTTKDVGKGSGLGLFIVHEIIEEHDGCIAVDSAVGKGTTFFIRLPLKKVTGNP
jgi:signal transduction histidine kinase